MPEFLRDNWFDLFQSIFIIASFMLAAMAWRSDKISRKSDTHLKVGESYKGLWDAFLENEEFRRITDPTVDLKENPVTEAERVLVRQLIVHLHGVFVAQKLNQIETVEGMDADVKNFYSKPIPKAVWRSVRSRQNADFRNYMDRLIGVGK